MSNLCRLCMGSKLLEDTFDDGINFSLKAVSCIGIQIYSNDGLPTKICKTCQEMVTIFYNFKQKCLEVDLKLRALASSQALSTQKCEVHSNTLNKQLDGGEVSTDTQLLNINNTENTKKKTINEKLIKHVFNSNYIKDKSLPTKKFQCEICGRIFKIKAGLENHILTHSGLKPFQCKLCPKRYCRLESVTIHMRSHAGIKPYVCEICGKTSTKHQDLVRHKKTHSDERNYICSTCNRHFKRASDVTSHMRTHTGMRPYSCQTCKKAYTSHSGLRKHYKLHCKKDIIVVSS